MLDIDADGMPDLGFFDAGTQRFTTYLNNGDGTFDFAGGIQLADTATGIVLIYDAMGPIAEPVGPWIGSTDFGASREGFGEGGDDYGGDGDGDGGDGGGGYGDEGDGGEWGDTFLHFVGEPFIAVWHDSLGALQVLDSAMLLDNSDGTGGDGTDGGTGNGTENDAVAWPFNGDYIDLPDGIYFATGSGGDAMTIMDFDNDGSPDVAVTNRDDDTISIISFAPEYEQLMKGGFDPATDDPIETTTIAVGDQPVHINAFDVNLDGFMDMIVSNAGDGTFSIIPGSESGFGTAQTIEVAADLTQAFLNFNAFGNELFVLGFSATGTITQLDFLDGSLQISEQDEGFFLANDEVLPRQTIVGEFTGDGFIDVAVIDQAGGNVVIYSNIAGDADDGEEEYDGPPIDSRDIPIPGVPDLIADSDSGESDSDNITAYNNAGEYTLSFDVRVSHVSGALADLRTTLTLFFEENGQQYDDDGFEYTPSIWINLFAGNVLIGSAEVGADDTVVTVETDGWTVLREGVHEIRAGFAIGAPGLRGLIGTSSGTLGIEVRVPRVEVEAPDEEGETVTIRTDESGQPVLVLEQSDGSGEAEEVHLAEFEGLPEITGSVVTMRETNSRSNASRYAAARSDEGLVLFVRDQDGDWGGRNLTAEIDDSEPITDSNISVLTTPWGNTNMAGLNEQGELIFYWQDGGVDENGDATWNFVNLADDQLRVNNQAVPRFSSSLASFVTPWGAMNVAGLDTDGNLRIIWWAPGLDNWVSTNLTEILGSTPLTGDIAAWVTPWGGINITGLNTAGEMVAVWWAPGGEWTVTPLGDNLGAPAFVSGSLTSIIGESGETFIAGITLPGEVGVFSWTPEGGSWDFITIDTLPDSAALVGSVSGYYTSDNNAVTLLVGSLDGDIYQLDGDASDIQTTWTVGLFNA
ncbi:hypothetical protein MNBD_PLANCTO03-301 [hydrothermal vent metagenome]|uniref:Uncharacterized protein n=1 Tax=hydrothermal vent metagenome TaxID=652676 RepID=A0A3B1DWQ3_9ZZZZ